MSIKVVKTKAQVKYPYSQAIIANGFIFCSGQLGRVPGTSTISADVTEQTHQVMKNLIEVLQAAGSDLNHVVKTTIYLVDIDDFVKVNQVYSHYFSEYKPARATVEVSRLAQGDLLSSPLVEIEAIAVSS